MKLRNQSIVKQVFSRDIGLCRACGFKGSEVHHVKPLVFGGEDRVENMMTLCYSCHKSAPNDPEEFVKYARSGGARLRRIFGEAMCFAELNKMNYMDWYPIVIGLLNSLRKMDYEDALDKFNLKESITITDFDLEIANKPIIVQEKKISLEKKKEIVTQNNPIVQP